MEKHRALRKESDSRNEAAGVVRKSLPIGQQRAHGPAVERAWAEVDQHCCQVATDANNQFYLSSTQLSPPLGYKKNRCS